MAITLSEAKQLTFREVLVEDNGCRWYVNGRVKTWKTDPLRIEVPLKHGLYTFGRLVTSDFDKDGVCNLLTKEKA